MTTEKKTNKKVFDVTVEGQVRKYAVQKPTNAISQKAQIVHGKAYKEALQGGLPNRAMLEKILRDAKLWDEGRQVEHEKLLKKIRDAEKAVLAGGMKKSELREKAVELRRLRIEQRQLLAERNREDAKTADAFADNARFNFLVAACTVDASTGERVYEDAEDYLSREDDPIGFSAAQHLGELLYELDPTWERNLPENKALLALGLCNDELHLVDAKGRKVDAKGRLVNEEGRYVDENGNYVDAEGTPLTADGDYVVEHKPFYDDDGKEIPNPFATKPAEVEKTSSEKSTEKSLEVATA